eukprot:767603-Hanusia_phi.AAC.2
MHQSRTRHARESRVGRGKADIIFVCWHKLCSQVQRSTASLNKKETPQRLSFILTFSRSLKPSSSISPPPISNFGPPSQSISSVSPRPILRLSLRLRLCPSCFFTSSGLLAHVPASLPHTAVSLHRHPRSWKTFRELREEGKEDREDEDERGGRDGKKNDEDKYGTGHEGREMGVKQRQMGSDMR